MGDFTGIFILICSVITSMCAVYGSIAIVNSIRAKALRDAADLQTGHKPDTANQWRNALIDSEARRKKGE